MRRSAIAAALLTLLVGAAPAGAKGVLSATVCGKSECREVDQRTVMPYLSEGGYPTEPPASAAPWYRVTIVMGDDLLPPAKRVRGRMTVSVVPDRSVLRGEDGDWMPMSADALQVYRTVTQGLEPLPASELPGVPDAPTDQGTGGGGAEGGPPAWLLIAGGLSLLGLTGLGLRRRVAARGA